MKKKLSVIIAVLIVGALLFTGYRTFLSPKGVKGTKKITIQVVNKNENIDKSYNFKTDHEFLYALLEENQEKLGLTFKKYDFGTMVTGVMKYAADESKNEYFHVTINGVDATAGPQETPLKDGDVIKYELRKF